MILDLSDEHLNHVYETDRLSVIETLYDTFNPDS